MTVPAPLTTDPRPGLARKKPAPTLVTGEAFAAMTELGRAELIEGKVIQMPPPKGKHGLTEGKFSLRIGNFVQQHQLGYVFVGETGVYIRRNPDTVRGMDVAYISNERWAQQPDPEGYLEIAPDLIVEILSPDDRWTAVIKKLKEYFSIGVRLVWVADPATHTVYAYRSVTNIQEFGESETLPGDEVLPGFSVPVADLFVF
jgi:Uma2 family endonuclease